MIEKHFQKDTKLTVTTVIDHKHGKN